MKPLASSDPGKVGPFRTIAVLGSGAMGRVLLARKAYEDLVALKRVHVAFVDDEGFRTRFRREVKASRKVRGRYTAKVIADNTEARVPWMATEYVSGVTLQAAVDSCGPFTDEAVLRLAAGLAAALADIHRVDLVHRDLKPSNIMLTHDGLKVIDFGIARAVDASTLTGTGTIMGSYAFMSPEQILADSADPASDVFALGAVLGFAATGHGPFDATTVPAITHRIINEPPRLEDVSGDLREFIEEILAKVPQERPLPGRILDSIPDGIRQSIDGSSTAPWNPAIHERIDRLGEEIEQYTEQTEVNGTVIDPDATAIPEDVARAETKIRAEPPAAEAKADGEAGRAGGVNAAEYVRELAAKLRVNLATVRPTGPEGSITSQDVREAATEAETARAKARAKEDAARARAAERVRAAKSAREKLKQGSANKSKTDSEAKSGPGPQRPETDTRPSSPAPTPAASSQKKPQWSGILAVLGLIGLGLVIFTPVGDIFEKDATPGGDDSSSASATGYDAAADDGVDDGIVTDTYEPPTTEAVDESAGCSSAFDTVDTYLDIANPALDGGDNAGAVAAFRDMASGLRVNATEANNILVQTNIGILADDSDKMADALVVQDNADYDYWRGVWTEDRDDLLDACYE